MGASAFLAWQIVKTSSVDALVRTNPTAAAQIAPNDPRIPFSLALLEFRATSGAIRPKTREAAVGALARAPLADEPFFFAGVAALIEKDEARAERLLAEARRRNPRARYARLLLLDRYLRAGKIAKATDEMSALGNLIPGAGGLLTAELARLAQSPATARALEQALQRNPSPRDGVLLQLAASGADPDLILRLARVVPAPSGSATTALWQAKLIESLVGRGDLPRAYGLWRAFSSPGAPERKTGIYDPNLQGMPGLAPFNWAFPPTTAGAAERSPTGLQVEFYGRDGAELANQLLLLPAGRHRLSFTAEGSADGESSKLSWQISCMESKAVIGEVALKKVTYSARRIAGEFVVPTGGCSAQWIKLVGSPSEFPKAQNATVRSLQLAPVR